MKQLIGAALAVSGFATLFAAGCSGSSFTDGSGGATSSSGTAGVSSAGSSGSGTSGGSASGGSSTGGGTDSGGSASGGTDNGGTDNGGSASGGVTTGGVTTGGATTGGATTGGSGGDGAACNADTDCTDCAYPTAPKTAADCYCANCAFTPMSKSQCMANQTEFAKVCANDHRICPAIACVLPPKPVCKSHMCVASSSPAP